MTPAEDHRKRYHEQYTHELCGTNVRVRMRGEDGASPHAATKPTSGIVERVVISARFGPLAKLLGDDEDTTWYLVKDLELGAKL